MSLSCEETLALKTQAASLPSLHFLSRIICLLEILPLHLFFLVVWFLIKAVVVFCFGDDCVALIKLHPIRLFTLESKWDPLGLKARMNEWDFLVLCMSVCTCVCNLLYFCTLVF